MRLLTAKIISYIIFMEMEKPPIVIKMGSNLLTSNNVETRGVNKRNIKSVAMQVSALMNDGHPVTIVSSGAIGVGFFRLPFLDRNNIIDKQAAAAAGQVEIVSTFQYYLEKSGIVVCQYLVRADDFLNIKYPLLTTLEAGGMPLLNDNDPVNSPEAERGIIIGDNDELALKTAIMVGAGRLFLLTGVNGVIGIDGRVIPEIRSGEEVEIRQDPKSELGTGGIQSKISVGKRAANSGIATYIANGRTSRVILRILEGEPLGTVFLP